MTNYVQSTNEFGSTINAYRDEDAKYIDAMLGENVVILKEDSEELALYLRAQEERLKETMVMQELAKFSDLSGVIEVAKKKGYPSLAALLLAALAAVPNFKK